MYTYIIHYNMAKEHEDGSDVAVVLRAGASIVNVKPVFSLDSKWLMCSTGDTIKVFSISSGQCTHTLTGHAGVVTGMTINPENQFQLLTCGSDMAVLKWDYADGVLLKRYHLQESLLTLYTVYSDTPGLYATTAKLGCSDVNLVSVRILKRVKDPVRTEVVLEKVGRHPTDVAIGCKGKVAATIFSSLLRIKILPGGKLQRHVAPYEDKFACVACHPTEQCIATGLANGKILLWYKFVGESNPIKTVNHWHALPVTDIAFTTEGSYYLSGGYECVLVKWQHNSQQRDTLPRLGAPIIGVSCSRDNTLYATSHADNGIQVITSNFKVIQIFQGLTQGHCDHQNKDSLPTGLLFDPRTKALVLNGRPGHLQFYSIHNDKQLFNLDIVGQNYISPENLKRPLVMTEVEKAAFSHDGFWLATVERRDDEETTPEIRLKFWAYSSKAQRYQLNTSVELPHERKITCLKFRPPVKGSDLMAVTTSEDCSFKLWSIVDDTDIYRKNVCWSCESVGYYRSQVAGPADFSQDGSLLAVAFGTVLSIWEPDTNSMKITLSHGLDKSPIRHLIFCRAAGSHILVTVTKGIIYAWNMLTCSVQWSKPLHVTTLTLSPVSGLMAVFTVKKEVFIFQPTEPEPIYHHHCLAKSAMIVSAIFVPHENSELCPYGEGELHWQNKEQLYFITRTQELCTLQMKVDAESSPLNTQKLSENLPETPFSALMTQQRTLGAKDMNLGPVGGKLGQPGGKFLHEMLSTAAHVLPPVSSLCMTFLDTLLIKQKDSENSLKDVDSDEDESMHIGSPSNSDTDEDENNEHCEKVKSLPEHSGSPTNTASYYTEYNSLSPEKTYQWILNS